MFRSFACLALLVLVASSSPARAEDSAKEHFKKGTTAYDLGRFADAAQEFEAAYELHNDPSLLYNIGQAHRFAGELDKAVLAYRSYLRNLPHAPNRAQVSITQLQAQIDARNKPSVEPAPVTATPVAVVDTAPPPPPTKTPVYKKWWLWTGSNEIAVTAPLGAHGDGSVYLVADDGKSFGGGFIANPAAFINGPDANAGFGY